MFYQKFKDTFIRLTFSVDGIGKDHDENRSMKGSFQKIIESYNEISPLRKKYDNLVLDTNTVFTSKTENNFTDIIDHLLKILNLTIIASPMLEVIFQMKK